VTFNIEGRLDLEVTSTFGQDMGVETPTTLNVSTDLAPALSRLNMHVEPSPSALAVKNVTGIGDVTDPVGRADPNAPTFRFWRLLYPPMLFHNETFDYVHQEDRRIILLGSRTAADLEDFNKFIAGQNAEAGWSDMCDAVKAVGARRTPEITLGHVGCFTFRNRAIPVAMIHITVNGEQRWVPVGTVLGDVLGQDEMPVPTSVIDFTPAKPAADRLAFTSQRSRRTLQRLRLERFFSGHTAILDKSSGSRGSTQLDHLLRLPLVSGDKLSW
jgi:hypothetical protein